jgi:hypothetical protein
MNYKYDGKTPLLVDEEVLVLRKQCMRFGRMEGPGIFDLSNGPSYCWDESPISRIIIAVPYTTVVY